MLNFAPAKGRLVEVRELLGGLPPPEVESWWGLVVARESSSEGSGASMGAGKYTGGVSTFVSRCYRLGFGGLTITPTKGKREASLGRRGSILGKSRGANIGLYAVYLSVGFCTRV